MREREKKETGLDSIAQQMVLERRDEFISQACTHIKIMLMCLSKPMSVFTNYKNNTP